MEKNNLHFHFFNRNLFIYQRTDYNQGRNINKTIPCWEREYRLQSITERTLALKYNYLGRLSIFLFRYIHTYYSVFFMSSLKKIISPSIWSISALQFGFVTLFVSASPLIPLLALIVNLLDIRYVVVDAYFEYLISISFMSETLYFYFFMAIFIECYYCLFALFFLRILLNNKTDLSRYLPIS